MEISQTLELIIRLAAASLIGAAIGFERKYRAKGAGIGTHVLVAIGSACSWSFPNTALPVQHASMPPV